MTTGQKRPRHKLRIDGGRGLSITLYFRTVEDRNLMELALGGAYCLNGKKARFQSIDVEVREEPDAGDSPFCDRIERALTKAG